MIVGSLSVTACADLSNISGNRDLAMMSHPDQYRGAQYHPHPRNLNLRQADLDFAAGVAYRGCVTMLRVSIADADVGKGLDCGSASRISLGAGVRYGDCVVLRPITLREAANGAGVLCDAEAGQMRAALGDVRLLAADTQNH